MPGVGVATGIFNVDALGRVADAVVENFNDLDQTIDIFLNTKLKQTDELDYNILANRKE